MHSTIYRNVRYVSTVCDKKGFGYIRGFDLYDGNVISLK